MSTEFEPIGVDIPPPSEQNGLKEKQREFLNQLDPVSMVVFYNINSHRSIRHLDQDPERVSFSPFSTQDYQRFNNISNRDRSAYWRNQPQQQTYDEQMQQWKRDSSDAVKNLSALYTEQSGDQGNWYERFLKQWGDRVGIVELTSESFDENAAQQVYDQYFTGENKASNTKVFVEDMIHTFRGFGIVPDEDKEVFEATKRDIRKKMSGMFGEDFAVVLEAITYIEELIRRDEGVLDNIGSVVKEVLASTAPYEFDEEQMKGLETLFAEDWSQDAGTEAQDEEPIRTQVPRGKFAADQGDEEDEQTRGEAHGEKVNGEVIYLHTLSPGPALRSESVDSVNDVPQPRNEPSIGHNGSENGSQYKYINEMVEQLNTTSIASRIYSGWSEDDVRAKGERLVLPELEGQGVFAWIPNVITLKKATDDQKGSFAVQFAKMQE